MKKMQIIKQGPFMAGMVGVVFSGLALLTASVASAQPVHLLHPTNATWRYLADGSDQGTAWQGTGFDDSAWPEGKGLFGNEGTVYAPLGFNTAIPGLTPINVYYRSTFNWVGGTFGVVLTGTNYVDDGSIIYLNGTEIARFNMPAGPAAFDTVAPVANPGGFPNVNAGEPVLVLLQIPLDSLTNGNVNPLVPGLNHIAVEVHQNSATSSDRAFGLSLFGQQAVAPCTDGIQPTNRVITTRRDTTFTVVLPSNCGVPTPSIQWYRNVGFGEEIIDGATSASYTKTNALDGIDDGVYYARLTNPSGTVDSRQAVLAVDPDTAAPQFLAAQVVGPGLNTFRLITDEPLCGDSLACGSDYTFQFNWQINQSDNTSIDLGVATIVQINATTYEFTTSAPRDPTKQYQITVTPIFGEVSDLGGIFVPPGTFAESGLEFSFQQGDANGYTGTQDVGIHSGTGVDTPDGANAIINVDSDDGGIRQALLRFDNIFGVAPGQVPPGAVITAATLTLNQTDNGNPVNLYRMLVTWDQTTATWNLLGGGLTADGTEAVATADAVTPGLNGVVGAITMDVTTSVRAWAAGQPNYGWALIPTGGDGWRWNSSESGAGTAPRLSVQFTVGVCTTAPSFTAQPPATTTVNELSSFSLSAGVDICGNAAFQWTKDGADIAGATSITYTVPSAAAGAGGSGGTYRLRASNQFGTVTSSPAVVNVNAKTTRPRVTRVVNGANGTTITVQFNEAVTAASAQNTANYTLTPSVAVSSAVLGANNTVTLTTAQRTAAAYSLRIAGVTDPAAVPNSINPNPTVVALTIGTSVTGAGYGDAWIYNDTENLDADPTWKDTAFVPGASWLNGNGLFGTETSAGVVALFPVPIATVIRANDVAPGDFVTVYFRKSITLPALSGGAMYVLDHMIDDGAVFYLNGVEFGRFNMPTGPVTYSTRASTANEASRQAIRLPASANAGGTFTLAVEVHQGGATTSSDIVFGAQVIGVSPRPALSISHGGNGNTVSWSGDSSWRLARSAVVTGPYAAVAGNPFHTFVVPPAANTNNAFFMLEFVPAP